MIHDVERIFLYTSPAGTALRLEGDALVIEGRGARRVLPAERILRVRLDPPMGFGKGRLRVETAEGEEEFAFRRPEYVRAATLQGGLSGLLPRREPPAEPGPASVADELLKLKGLLDSGALTAGEFEAAKRKLLE